MSDQPRPTSTPNVGMEQLITQQYHNHSVHINPKFKNVHINPNFIPKKPLHTSPTNNIHINPKFVNTITTQNQQSTAISNVQPDIRINNTKSAINEAKIITKTTRKLVRQPIVPLSSSSSSSSFPSSTVSTKLSPLSKHITQINPLVKIGQRKLVRTSHPTTSVTSTTNTITSTTSTTTKPKIISPIDQILKLRTSSKIIHSKYKIINNKKLIRKSEPENVYKIDRRIVNISPSLKPNGMSPLITGSRSLWRNSASKTHHIFNENLTSHKVIITDHKLQRIGTTTQKLKTIFSRTQQSPTKTRLSITKNKKLSLLNINGVFYRSTQTKLQKQDLNKESSTISLAPTSTASTTKSNIVSNIRKSKFASIANKNHRMVIVRGAKFFLDAGGKKLVRATSNPTVIPTTNITNINNNIRSTAARTTSATDNQEYNITPMKRITIGGLTYIAKSNNTYERTDFHKTRIHLSVAKHKSIHLLSRNLVKSNIPCVIFQKLGKCRALDRGRCTKVHDIKRVAICSKFLKGSCTVDKCLLSHSVTLSKMPTCRFFLLGMCSKTDCPYLHKKVTANTEICPDFIKGFCELAEKCTMRHDFLCPDYESKGKCEKNRCPYTHKGKLKEIRNIKKINQSEPMTGPVTVTLSATTKIPATEILKKTCDEFEKLDKPMEIDIETTAATNNIRYFIDTKRENVSTKIGLNMKELSIENKAKLSRALQKTEQMKAYLNLIGDSSSNSTIVKTIGGATAELVMETKDDGKLDDEKMLITNKTEIQDDVADDDDDDDGVQLLIPSRPRLGSLPSFIPIG